MAGLVPAIHVIRVASRQNVDARHTAGHVPAITFERALNRTLQVRSAAKLRLASG
jgi:hypothetical protein